MQIWSNSFRPYAFMDERLAFGKHDPANHFALAGNRNPHLAWSAPPAGTQSLCVVCWDPDVPSVGDDVNQEGKTVPVDLPRVDFFHWALCDLPPDLREIPEGSHADGITPMGKPPGDSPHGGLQGVNDYTRWFMGNEEMEGEYGGYDGPAPPWNDERVHGYHFGVFALQVKSLGFSSGFTGSKLMKAIRSHVLAQSVVVGLYAINPDARRWHLEGLR